MNELVPAGNKVTPDVFISNEPQERPSITVLEALAQGVPLVAIPITNDQPAVAARIAWSGTGSVLPLKRLRGDRLRTLAVTVMGRHRIGRMPADYRPKSQV